VDDTLTRDSPFTDVRGNSVSDAPTDLLIVTNSTDATVDLLFKHGLPNRLHVFRFNFDLFEAYDVACEPENFELVDPIGRRCTLATTRKAYLRKPLPASNLSAEAAYLQAEQSYALRSILNMLWRCEKLVLVEPDAERTRLDKFRQLSVASRYFRVPRGMFANRPIKHWTDANLTVVKSLSGAYLGDNVVFTTLINPEELTTGYPWFLQQYVSAPFDLTSVFVRGRVFSYRLDRTFLKETPDWRASREENTYARGTWVPIDTSTSLDARIQGYMRDLQLHYGRLDFLVDHAGDVVFCEVNPNGQFGWLDPTDATGLISTIAREIAPDTEVAPLPYSPFGVPTAASGAT